MSPKVWSDELLVLEESMPDTFCGGAHGNSSISYRTYDLSTGKKLDPWSWIKGGGKAVEITEDKEHKPIKPRLKILLEKNNPRRDDSECAEAADDMSVLSPYPTPAGMVFPVSYPHAMRACDDDITVSWKQLDPFLTPAGKAAAQIWTRPANKAP